MSALLPIPETLLQLDLPDSNALSLSSMVVKALPFKVLIIFENRRKSHWATSGEYENLSVVLLINCGKNSCS